MKHEEIHDIFNMYDVKVRLTELPQNQLQIQYSSGKYTEFVRVLNENFNTGLSKGNKAYIDVADPDNAIQKSVTYLDKKFPENYE